MLKRAIRLSVASAAAVAALLAPAGASAVGSGTFTRITQPGGTTTVSFDGNHPGTSHLTVSGNTSPDVASVDIDCIDVLQNGPSSLTLASNVPVASRAFSTVVTFLNPLFNCRLRAIPSGVNSQSAYLGSYSGPILYMDSVVDDTMGSTVYGYTVVGEQGDGAAEAQSAAQCGAGLTATIEVPGMELLGSGSSPCAFTLPSGNVTAASPTASAVRVDNHNAYLPFSVHSYLNGSLGLSLTQTALATTLTRSSNGDLTVTESAPLVRCSVADTYPPTLASCPSLTSTGVTFARTLNLFRGDHQIRIRDAFTSADHHAHTIAVQYQGSLDETPPTGAVGYMFPGGGSTFQMTGPNQVVTGLGTRAGTMFLRSDLYSVEGDPEADTLGLTWSRAPQEVLFSGSVQNYFALPYSLAVPANGTARLGFASSDPVETKDSRALAALAVNEMVSAPVIGSPANGARIRGHTTTVNGSVALGANGLPMRVLVNGHGARLTKLSTTREAYTVSFSEPFSRHAIRVTASDSAGNTRSTSIIVTNVRA